MDNNYRLLDLTVYGRQETWEDSPPGWPQSEVMETLRTNGRPTSQWPRVKAGYSDHLGGGSRWTGLVPITLLATLRELLTIEAQCGFIYIRADEPAQSRQ